jgi:Domain of unknown function (DUF4173)
LQRASNLHGGHTKATWRQHQGSTAGAYAGCSLHKKGQQVRFSFGLKAAAVMALIVLFDHLFCDSFGGARIGGFAGAWIVALVLVRRDVRKSRVARVALMGAILFAASLFDDPGLLAWSMFWCSISFVALLPRAGRFDDAWHWGARLFLHGATGALRPLTDLQRAARQLRGLGGSPRSLAATLALPFLGGGLFLMLFAAANPLIERAFASIQLPSLWQLAVWTFVACCVWPTMRPGTLALRVARRLPDPEPILPGTSLPSVLIALALFNLIFATQNALDIAFLWSGSALPEGMTQTEYVHRGAYPLIGTALIAGAMALAMLRPGSASERHPWARRLVALWVAQNLVLVASSALRTVEYIHESMLTSWRIAALLWMALVALGLVLICWRILRGRSARWLINWNALAAGVVLTACCFIDLDAIAARWNVQAADPAKIDLCYLHRGGDSALLPLLALERRPMDAETLDRVRYVRADLLRDLEARQADGRYWTWHGARRLAAARAILGTGAPRPLPANYSRDWCDGSIFYPPVRS